MPGSEPLLAADRARLSAAVRDAGTIALKFFRGTFKSWTKGTGDSPVSEADIAVNDPDGFRRFVELAREGAAA